MSVVAIVISVVALLVAIGTAIFERRDRQAQLDILRDQLTAQTRAEMYAERGEIRWDPTEYDFLVGNAGPAVARNIRLWLQAGEDASAGAVEFEPMLAGHHQRITIHVGRPLAYIVGLYTTIDLRCSWTDDSGDRDEVLVGGLPSGS